MKKTLAQHFTIVALIYSAHSIALSSKQIINFLLQKKGVGAQHRTQLKHINQYVEVAEKHFLKAVLNIHKGIPPSNPIMSLFDKFPIAIDSISKGMSGTEIMKGHYEVFDQLHNNGLAFQRISEALEQQLLIYPNEREQQQIHDLKKKLKKSKKKARKEEPDSIVHFFKDVIQTVLFRDTKESVSIGANDQPLDLSILDNYEQQ